MNDRLRELRDVVGYLQLTAIEAADDGRHREAALRRLIAQQLLTGAHIGATHAYQDLRRGERQRSSPGAGQNSREAAAARQSAPERRYEPCEFAQDGPED